MEPVENSDAQDAKGVIAVRAGREAMSRQRLPYYVGISSATAGAKGISMNLIVIPPAGAAKPHLHKGYETAIYFAQRHRGDALRRRSGEFNRLPGRRVCLHQAGRAASTD